MWEYITSIVHQYRIHHIREKAAALAYYALISLAPLLIILIALGSFLFGADIIRTEILVQVQSTLGEQFRGFLEKFFESLHSDIESKVAYSIVGVLVLLYGATHLFSHIRTTLQVIFTIPEKQENKVNSFFKRHFTAILYIFSAVVILLFLSLANISMVIFLNLFYRGSLSPFIFQLTSSLVSLGVGTLVFALLYRSASEKTLSWKQVLKGGFTAAMSVFLLIVLFSLYIKYSVILSVYGASFFIVAFLLLAYYASVALLIGALVAYK